ncbi:hypothetical protein QAD02_022422 [Eretmocerus hayati]|uniref:Uncharacterized protein n=1 Tax=Eretmocerus hayati TaxID=131215 RepID=A0ACC2PU27_9HYME|nr:hypothetical protein QAD02_022422 [Eretmocerus hayati]
MGNQTAKAEAKPSIAEKKPLKPCCACPETKNIRDECLAVFLEHFPPHFDYIESKDTVSYVLRNALLHIYFFYEQVVYFLEHNAISDHANKEYLLFDQPDAI